MTESNSNPQQYNGVMVEWYDKKTDSDIQIAGGPTSVPRQGRVVGANVLPGQNGALAVVLIVAGNDKQWYVLDSGMCKIIDL